MSDEDTTEQTEEEYKPRHEPGSALLGEATRRRRELLDITQEDVANRFGGPSVASLRTIENAQANSYRAKTLLSLDRALAWPRGTSMSLLSGNTDRLDQNYIFSLHENFSIDLFWAGDHQDFDQFVDHVVNDISDEAMIEYDIPVSSASQRELTPGHYTEYAVTSDTSPSTPVSTDIKEAAPQLPEPREEDSQRLTRRSWDRDAASTDQREVERLRAVLRDVYRSMHPFMDALDTTQEALYDVRVDVAILARVSEDMDLPPIIKKSIKSLDHNLQRYSSLIIDKKAWVALAREMPRLADEIEEPGVDDGER